jgi:hypothetical protein
VVLVERVDGTIRPSVCCLLVLKFSNLYTAVDTPDRGRVVLLYRYFSNHDDKVVTLGPREVEFGMVK